MPELDFLPLADRRHRRRELELGVRYQIAILGAKSGWEWESLGARSGVE